MKKFSFFPCKDIPEVLIVEPYLFSDNRGYFYESFSERDFNEELGTNFHFVQDNQSSSKAYVCRGMHFQIPPHEQTKLVRCIKGSIIDIALDIREESPTYMKYVAVKLTADNHRQLLIPKGFAHGFIALNDDSILSYKCDDYYYSECDRSIQMFDTSLNIKEVLNVPQDWIQQSNKDFNAPCLSSIENPFNYETYKTNYKVNEYGE